jgi:hypothetical protein
MFYIAHYHIHYLCYYLSLYDVHTYLYLHSLCVCVYVISICLYTIYVCVCKKILHRVRLFLSILFGKHYENLDSGTGACLLLVLLASSIHDCGLLQRKPSFFLRPFIVLLACVLPIWRPLSFVCTCIYIYFMLVLYSTLCMMLPLTVCAPCCSMEYGFMM